MSTCVSYRNDEICTREFATLAFDMLMCLLSSRARIQNRPYEYTLLQNCSSHTPLRIRLYTVLTLNLQEPATAVLNTNVVDETWRYRWRRPSPHMMSSKASGSKHVSMMYFRAQLLDPLHKCFYPPTWPNRKPTRLTSGFGPFPPKRLAF
jgi:hypothetical protein